MIINIMVDWGATSYYDAGKRHIKTNWNISLPPLQGHTIRLTDFIGDSLNEDEKFDYFGDEINVFSYVEEAYNWIVKDIEWRREKENIIGYVYVTDIE